MNTFSKLLAGITLLSTLYVHQSEAFCAKCAKIEAERAKEQALHPQPERYYEDYQQGAIDSTGSDTETSPLPSGNPLPPKKKGEATPPAAHSKIKELATTHERSKTKLSDNDRTIALVEVPSPSTPTLPQSAPQSYSMIYTILKTKNFLEAFDGPFTLFIPTNEAVLRLPPGLLVSLSRRDASEKLAALVSNHITTQKILREDFPNDGVTEVKAISGRNLKLSEKEGVLYVDNIKILQTEPAGYNGVIYVIDQVLNP